MKRTVLIVVLVVVAALAIVALLIQLVPYGRNHTNPPVVREPNWDSAQTRALAQRACFDCHSNETNWNHWYVNVAPFSWLVQRDVDEGRFHMNFSNWGAAHGGEEGGREHDDAGEMIMSGEMPPFQYLLMHPEAKLTDAEKQQLADGLSKLEMTMP